MEIEEKYRLAVQCLQAIAQRTGTNKVDGYEVWDEWTEARAFKDCSIAAENTLKRIGEPTRLPNKLKKEEGR